MRISDWSSDVCSSDLAASAQGIKVDGYKPDEKTKAAAEREALRQGGVPDNQARSTRTANQARDTREQAEPRADLAERFRRQSDVQNAKDPELRKAQSHVALAMAVAAERFPRSEEHNSELQSLMRISYAVFCLIKKKIKKCRDARPDRSID